MIKIINTFNEINTLISKMKGSFNFQLWLEYVKKISASLPEKLLEDSKEYNYEKDLLPVLNYFINNKEKFIEAHESFLKATEILSERFLKTFNSNLQITVIFYLGLCNGAGWATTLDDTDTILLGVEKIVELDWTSFEKMSGLIFHEVGHLWHFSIKKPETPKNNFDKYLYQLFSEGIAMYSEQLLFGDFNYYHSWNDEWVQWCQNNTLSNFSEYLKRLKNNQSAQEFFGDWNNYRGYSDVGYFMGCQFIKYLTKFYSINEIAKFNNNEVFAELQKYYLHLEENF